MKLRFFLIPAACFLFITIMSSCTREYICQCTITYSGAPGLPDTTINEYIIRDTKKKAESACEANSGTYESGNIRSEEKCKLF